MEKQDNDNKGYFHGSLRSPHDMEEEEIPRTDGWRKLLGKRSSEIPGLSGKGGDQIHGKMKISVIGKRI